MTYDEKLKIEKKVYLYSILIFIAGVIFFYFSCRLDIDKGLNGDLTQRSGSVIVFLGVLVEYELYKNISTIKLHPSIDVPIHEKQRNMPKIYDNLKSIAHGFIIFGTLVWGYADLIWKQFLYN